MNRFLAVCLWFLAAYSGSLSAQTVVYIHTDALGSVVAETDANRNVLERREYEPYGQQLAPAVKNGPGYTGHVQDASTGLVYMQQRYYDPTIGTFLSVDAVTAYQKPITNFNRYVYGRSNPYRFTDPDGRDSVGEMIDSGADGCGPVTCLGWAGTKALWSVFGAEGVIQFYDKGGDAETADKGMAVFEVATLGQGGKVGAGIKVFRGLFAGARAPILEGAAFAQKTFSRSFSSSGKFAGMTIDDVAGALSTGKMKAADVPIEFIVRDGNTLILNTRSAQALQQAGIPRSQWNAVDMTGNAAAETRLTEQLRRYNLDSSGFAIPVQSR